ncbi:MAG: NAD(P)H-binding protein [Leptospiraceae bacterium]|nr:NAD(P)H-binding protein [Leptospiraceae bacterium]MCP5510727.1 NAD(P)H-binding protein [Leptospiraceae bacterium]
MKTILIVGSSGRVGRSLLGFKSSFEYKLIGFQRTNLDESGDSEGVEFVFGDVLDFTKLEDAIKKADIVFSVLSGRKTKPDYSILSIGMKNILDAMKKNGKRRLINLGGAGVLDDPDYGKYRNRPSYPEFFKNVSAENLKVLSLLEASGLDWTMICAPEMPEGAAQGNYRLEIDFMPTGGRRISVGDVALCMYEIIEKNEYFKKKVGIAY